ncbi:MAG: phage integrase SAM-like domain-containing protein [Solobacterium sp.]|nr:phage integrase SAM-like domain-containing protein [Solobacterium sp.]
MKNRIPDGLTAAQWAAVIKGLEARPSTVNDYRKVLNLLHSYNDGVFQIGSMTREQAAEYFQYLDSRQNAGTLSENTVHRYKATLRSIGARVEHAPELWPGYHNPFSGLVSNENRRRTEFRSEMFADPEDIRKIRALLPKLSKEEQLILLLMMNLGLTPAQIQNLKISSFSMVPGGSGRIALKVDLGSFLELTSSPWKESPYYKEGYPIRFVRKSPNRSITWNYSGTFVFLPEFAELLRSYYEYVGVSTDTRAFFLTARHLEFNYRAMHHMILGISAAIGVDSGKITPNMISRYGMMHSYMLDRCHRRHAELTEAITNASEGEKPALEQALSENDRLGKALEEDGWIGDWEGFFPLPLKEKAESAIRQLGEDFILRSLGY